LDDEIKISQAQENILKQKNLERNNISAFLVSKNPEEQNDGFQKDALNTEWSTSEELSTTRSISSVNQEQEYFQLKFRKIIQ